MSGYKINPSGIRPKPSWWLISNEGWTVPEGFVIVDVIGDISNWIEEQSLQDWKKFNQGPEIIEILHRYIISESLLTLLTLTWS